MYQIEWGNGSTDVFADEDEARSCYADNAEILDIAITTGTTIDRAEHCSGSAALALGWNNRHVEWSERATRALLVEIATEHLRGIKPGLSGQTLAQVR
jgi:hypothetical protein